MTGLTASTAYYFRVRAVNGNGNSAYSSTATATTSAPPVINLPPVAPSSLAASPISQSGALLTWVDNATDETGVEIARSLDGVAWVTITTTAANAEEFINNGLLPATSYEYRIRAVNEYGFSAWIGDVVVTTPASVSRTPRRPRSNPNTGTP